jgi:hypothetical protein
MINCREKQLIIYYKKNITIFIEISNSLRCSDILIKIFICVFVLDLYSNKKMKI